MSWFSDVVDPKDRALPLGLASPEADRLPEEEPAHAEHDKEQEDPENGSKALCPGGYQAEGQHSRPGAEPEEPQGDRSLHG